MATKVADRVVLDTNVLLGATDEAREEYDHAVTALTTWPASGVVLYTSGQILREYLVVATRPLGRNGLGMTPSDAMENVRILGARLHRLAEDVKVSDRLLALIDEVDCSGKQIHDANVVATMLVHGVETLVTRNVEDFARFGDHIHVVGLRP